MCFGKIFLAIAWIVFFKATCGVCCDYNPGCVGWTSETYCVTNTSCVWSDSKCREKGCSEISGQNNCESAGCVYSGSTCRKATSCNEIVQPAACNNAEVDGKRCMNFLAGCKVPSCADFKNSEVECETTHSPWLKGHCRFDTGTSSCTLTTSCGDWKGHTNCNDKKFDDKQCSQIGSECKIATCEDFSHTSSTDCESTSNGVAGRCKYNTDETCTLTTSCSDWNGRSGSCSGKYYDDIGCTYEAGVCRPSTCSDYSYGTCYPYAGCIVEDPSGSPKCITVSSCSVWNADDTSCDLGFSSDGKCFYRSDHQCVLRPSCSSLTDEMNCRPNIGCFFVEVCPVEDPPSHATFLRVSSLLVILLLAFLV